MSDFQGHLLPRNIGVSSGGGGGTVTSINGDGTAAQTLTVGTAGTDFAIVDAGGGSHVFNLPTASASNRGALSSADWSTFNSKQSALTIGNLTDAGTDGITVTSGTGAVIGSGTSLSQHVADTTHNGYLSSTDWNTFNSKQIVNYTATAISYTVLSTDYIVGVTSTAAARTLTLPSAVTVGAGKTYVIKDQSGAAGTNNITLATTGGQTIDGASTFVINSNYGAVNLYSNGTNWFIY